MNNNKIKYNYKIKIKIIAYNCFGDIFSESLVIIFIKQQRVSKGFIYFFIIYI